MAYNKITFGLISMVMMTFYVMFVITVSAQAPPPPSDDPNSSAQACNVDADCDSGNWCREGFCGAYVLEDDWCGGFLPPPSERRCAPGLTCTDFPRDPLLADDGNGYCRRQCSSSADCDGDDYCAADGVCRAAGSCSVAADCQNVDNTWVRLLCFGTITCEREIDVGYCRVTCAASGKSRPLAGATNVSARPKASVASA